MTTTEQQPSDRLSPQSPWPGLRPFAEGDREFFFGRDAERDAVLQLLQRVTVVVLYGQSGLGKTSLLQAGLFAPMRDAGLLPVWVRLDHDERAPSLASQIKSALTRALDAAQITGPRPTESESLWEYFHKRDVEFWGARNRLITPVIVLDQFEEIFTLGQRSSAASDRVSAFTTELEQLIEHRPPPAVRDHLEEHVEEAARFDFRREGVKLAITLREDFLAQLDPWRQRMPSLLRNRFRLERMTGAQAIDVVTRAGGDLVSADVAREIVAFVSQSQRRKATVDLQDRAVEPALLSVVCDELNRRRVAEGRASITTALLTGAREGIIQAFYERAFEGVDERVREWVEDELLTASGYRDRGALEDALKVGLSERDFDRLIDQRILHREERDGVAWVELTHDLLTDPASQSRAKRDQRRQADVATAREQEIAVRLRRTTRLAMVFGGLLVVTVAALVFAYRESNRAAEAQANLQLQFDRVVSAEAAATTQAERAAASAASAQSAAQAASESFDSALVMADNLGLQLMDSMRQDMRSRSSTVLDAIARADESYARLAERQPDSLEVRASYARFLSSAAAVLYQAGRMTRGLELSNRALALVEQQTTESARIPAEVEAEVRAAVGNGQFRVGNLGDALRSLGRAVELASSSSPEMTERARRVVVEAQLRMGDIDLLAYATPSAERHFREALRLTGSTKTAEARSWRVEALMGTGRTATEDAKELQFYEEADPILAPLLEEDTSNPKLRRLSADLLLNRGAVSADMNRRWDAHEFYRRALEVTQSLVDYDPQNLRWQYDLARVLRAKSQQQELRKDLLAEVGRANATLRKVVLAGEPQWRSARYVLGTLEWDRANNSSDEDARKGFAESLAIFSDLARDPLDGLASRGAVFAHTSLATHFAKTAPAQSATHLDEAMRSLRRFGAAADREVELLQSQALVLSGQATLREEAKDLEGEKVLRRKASQMYAARAAQTRLAPHYRDHAVSLILEANTFYRAKLEEEVQSRLREAMDAARQASKSDPDSPADLETRVRLATVQLLMTSAVTVAAQIDGIEPQLSHLWAGLQRFPNDAQLVERLRLVRDFLEARKKTATPQQVKRIEAILASRPQAGPADWVMKPFFSAAWRNLVGNDLKDAATYVTGTGAFPEFNARQVVAVREAPLTFRKGGSVMEAAFDTGGGQLRIGAILRTPGVDRNKRPVVTPLRLDGTSPRVHEMNSDGETLINTPAEAEQYLRFFMGMLQGDEGVFGIVESADDVRWRSDAQASLRQTLGKLTRPFTVKRQADGKWTAAATLVYQRAFFLADLELPADGKVEMKEDYPLAVDLPVRIERFVGGLRTIEGDTAPDDAKKWDLIVATKAGTYATERAGKKDYVGGAIFQRVLTESLVETGADAGAVNGAHLRLSWYELFARQFAEALATTEAGEKHSPGNLPLATNRAHALLFLGRVADAEAIYSGNSGRRMPASEDLWDDVILDDLRQLEEAGITHPEMARIRRLLKPSKK